jgi:hypothetical protein
MHFHAPFSKQIGVGVRGHAGTSFPSRRRVAFVGGAHQRNVSDDGNEFIADVPVDDDLGIEGRRPVL